MASWKSPREMGSQGGSHEDSVMRRGQVGSCHREGKAPAKHSGRKSRVQDGCSRPAGVSTSPGKL